MPRGNFTLLLTVTSVILGLLITLTGTHGGFYCDVETEEGVQECQKFGITEKKAEICKGSSFMIHAQIEGGEVIVMCPWSTATVVILIVGALSALAYTVSTIMQRNQKKVLAGRTLLIVGLASLGVLVLSAILMLSDIVSGISKCGLFEQDLQASGTDCSTSIFNITLMFAVISLGLVAYEIFLGYSRFKSENSDIETEGVYVPNADFKGGYFQEADY